MPIPFTPRHRVVLATKQIASRCPQCVELLQIDAIQKGLERLRRKLLISPTRQARIGVAYVAVTPDVEGQHQSAIWRVGNQTVHRGTLAWRGRIVYGLAVVQNVSGIEHQSADAFRHSLHDLADDTPGKAVTDKDHLCQLPVNNEIHDRLRTFSVGHSLVGPLAVPGDRGRIGRVPVVLQPLDHPVPCASVMKRAMDKNKSRQVNTSSRSVEVLGNEPAQPSTASPTCAAAEVTSVSSESMMSACLVIAQNARYGGWSTHATRLGARKCRSTVC